MTQRNDPTVEQRMQAVAGQSLQGFSEYEREEYVISMAKEFETILNNICRHNQIALKFSVDMERLGSNDEES